MVISFIADSDYIYTCRACSFPKSVNPYDSEPIAGFETIIFLTFDSPYI